MLRRMVLFFRRLLLLAAIAALAGCLMGDFGNRSFKPPASVPGRPYVLETTGYCECRECCGWHRNWLFMPVTSSGQYKKIGQTASGTQARPGTIAADTTLLPFGTIIYVPGYGYGRVEDRGGDIKGWHIDLYFEDHGTAKQWGRVKKQVQIWLPQDLKR